MRKLGIAAKWRTLTLVGGILAVGITGLVQSQKTEAAPQPDCGPTREWICVVPGCPSCPDYLFEGTVCEKAAYEKKTGRVCSPA